MHWKYREYGIQKLVIPIVIGAFGAESLLTEYLTLIGVMTRKGGSMLQTDVLGSAHI